MDELARNMPLCAPFIRSYNCLSVPPATHHRFEVLPEYQPILREIGLDAETIFTHPDIQVWRSIKERENCTLDANLVDGRHVRLHIKRFRANGGRLRPADVEADAI